MLPEKSFSFPEKSSQVCGIKLQKSQAYIPCKTNVLNETKHSVSRMTPTIEYRRGSVDDLSKLRLASDLSVTPASIEFNVIGAGHEFWIATADDEIVGLTVLASTTRAQHTILYLNVSAAHKSRGVGSALIRAVIESYPESEFAVIPLDGTEEFYRRLGFVKTKKWEMRRPPSPPQR